MKQKQTFNPVKEDKTGVKAQRMIWSTNVLDKALKGLNEGRKLLFNPFYENNTKLMKGDLVFERTQEELKEWKKCKKDILYFAEKYCKLMTPKGVKNIKLRDYQQEYLQHLEKNRLSIMVSCRQAGKCLNLTTTIIVKISDVFWDSFGQMLKKSWDSLYYIKEQDVYMLPLFELYNLYDTSILWKLKYQLYKMLYKVICLYNKDFDATLKLIKLISYLDKFERNDEKLIKSFELDGVYLDTDTGFKPASHIHLTKSFKIYRIRLENDLWLECADNHIVFDSDMNEVFVKDLTIGQPIQTKYGLSKVVELSHTQDEICMCDITINDENHRYYSNEILSHNTTTSAIFMLHYILFNVDKNSLVLGDKRKTAIEILSKVKSIYYELPYFLKPGIYKWNEGEIVLDNGCRCMAEATTPNSGISFTFHCVLADEFSKINKNIQEVFYSHLFPTITAASARFMISSTVNGKDLFYRLYMAARMGENDYAPFTVTWDRVPEWNPETQKWEKRDEVWHRKQIANYGSEEAFESQFGINFDVTSNTLINRKTLQKVRQKTIKFVNKELPGVSYSNNFYWHPDYEPAQTHNEFIIMSTDIAEGLGMDYTLAPVCRLVARNNQSCLELVGYFRSNNTPREYCAAAVVEFIDKYCNQERCLLSVEKNTYGELFVNDIKKLSESGVLSNFDFGCIVKYYNDSMTNYSLGIKITPGNKTPHCRLFQEDFERGLIIAESDIFIFELENFCDDGTGHYKASFGHDDTVMALVQLEYVKKTLQYKNILSDFESYNPETQDDKYYDPFDRNYMIQNAIDISSQSSIYNELAEYIKSNTSRLL